MSLPFFGITSPYAINTFKERMKVAAGSVPNKGTSPWKGGPIPMGPSKKEVATVSKSQQLMAKENKYSAHNYHPLDVVVDRASGIYVYDPEGYQYMDFLSAYSAVNQGHCHPYVTEAMIAQAGKVTLSSRAFHNSAYPDFAEYITKLFNYDKVLPMNTGAEGVETAMKAAKKWGYQKKGVPRGEALIISCNGCFHGRTVGCISLSSDPSAREEYEPLLPGIIHIDYNNASQLEAVLKEHGKNVVAFIVEPIQGEAGIIVPDKGYLTKCKQLCEEHNVLFVADEIQTGLGRTGKLLAVDWENVKPDLLVLGKALTGGFYPCSVVLGNDHIMECFQPGTHGSTFGGNPLSSAIAVAALQVLVNENLSRNAEKMGNIFLTEMEKIKNKFSFIKEVRGKGLLDGVEIDHSDKAPDAYDICLRLKSAGILAKQTHEYTIRFAPPLVIKEEEMAIALHRIHNVLATY